MTLPGFEGLDYLPDLARLEWLWHGLYYAEDDPAFDARLFAQDFARNAAEDAESIVERATEVLQEAFPDGYEAPTAVHVTTWGQDPFSLGSYSTPAIGVSAKDYEQLSQPVAGRVLFAGEAT